MVLRSLLQQALLVAKVRSKLHCNLSSKSLSLTLTMGCGLADDTFPLPTDIPPGVESINNIQGIFPQGCQWQDVQNEAQAVKKKFWAKEEYEYWHGDVKQWQADMPDTCSVRGKPAKDRYADDTVHFHHCGSGFYISMQR